MGDHGEKIVFLARELLKAGVPEVPPARKSFNVTMTFKTLCFATTLAAAGGGLVSALACEKNQPIGHYEKTEMRALVYYVVKFKGLDESVLRREIEQKSGVDDLDDVTVGAFPAVRRYLQEQAQ